MDEVNTLVDRNAFEQRWRRRFQDYAERNEDDAGIAGWTATGLEARFRHFRSNWRPFVAGGQWLDAGCGAGTYARFLAGQGQKVLGLDYSPVSVHKARARADGDVRWGVGDVTRLPLRDASCDGALCFGVLQALADSGPALRELSRVLKPGGELWIDALNAGCAPHLVHLLLRRLRRLPPHLRYERPPRLMRALGEAGLVDVRRLWVPILPARLARFQPLLEHPLAVVLLRLLPFLGMLFSHSFTVTGRKPGG